MSDPTRTNIVRGPGAVKFGNVVLHDADGISADVAVETVPVPSSIEGEIDRMVSNRYAEISLKPVGHLSSGILAALFPHQTPVIGTPLFGAADVPLLVHSKAGVLVTFPNAALVQPPQLRLSTVATAFGSAARFRALIALAAEPGDSGSLLTVASSAYSAATYPFSAVAKGGRYIGTLGTGEGAVEIRTQSGWTVDVALATASFATDVEGELAMDLAGVTCVARCTPSQSTEAALMALLPWNSAQGASARSGKNLVISAGTGSGVVKVTLYDVAVLAGPLRWGGVAIRAGEYAFTASRTVANDALGALYTVEMEPAGT